MAVAIPSADAVLNAASADIDLAAQAALANYRRRVAAGEASAAALKAILAEFEEQALAAMVAGFGRLLEQPPTPDAVRALQIGELTLSRRLYAQRQQTQAAVAGIVRQHARAATNASELARALYDGYNTPRNVEPLQIRKDVKLRREVQELMRLSMKDPAARVRIEQLQRSVLGGPGIRTAALRSAYEQLFAEAIAGASERRRDRALRQVIEERNRYFANRIAQTELARAHADRVADELLADETIEVVEVRLSPSHPVVDICDLFARQDRYGLGPGLYPKLSAPRPTFHPFCRCRLVSRPDVSARAAREREAAGRTFLRSLPTAEAARVMGSRDKLQKVLRGADPLTIVNRGRPDGYRIIELDAVAEVDRHRVRRHVAESMRGSADAREVLGTVGVRAGAEIRALTGRNVTGLRRVLEANAVRHIMKTHGNSPREAARGQIAVTAEDFLLSQRVSELGDRAVGDRLHRGSPTTVAALEISGVLYVLVEEARSKDLSVVTMYKRRAKEKPTGGT